MIPADRCELCGTHTDDLHTDPDTLADVCADCCARCGWLEGAGAVLTAGGVER